MAKPAPWFKDNDPELTAADRRDWIAVLPLGAHEQHGPHLPFETDTIIAAGIAERVVAALAEHLPVTMLPVEPVGYSIEHMDTEGTLSLAFDEAYLNTDGAYARYRRATLWNPADPSQPDETLLAFLLTLKKDAHPHGGAHFYASPNSDLLGILIERATGERYADVLSTRLWKPLGAKNHASVTVDAEGTARAAGGISVTARDLARRWDTCGSWLASDEDRQDTASTSSLASQLQHLSLHPARPARPRPHAPLYFPAFPE